MKILIDIGHPAHVHLFKNMIRILKSKNHEILVTARDKDITMCLLKHFQIKFIKRPTSKKNMLSKIWGIFTITYKLWKISKTFQPDIVIGGVGNAYIAILGRIIKKPSIIFDDTEHSKYELFIVKLLSKVIITPDCYIKKLGVKQIQYSGYHELAYLHPSQFIPNINILKDLGIAQNEKYTIIRFVSWEANHDMGHTGISNFNKINAVNEFSKYSKVFITSEIKLPKEIEKYKINIPPEKLHDVLAFASLLYGESATMASECAILGIPSIYIDNNGRGYTFDQEKKYNLVYNFKETEKDQENSIRKGIEILKNSKLNSNYSNQGRRLIDEKINVTAFMTWFVETYPVSYKIMKESPNYQLKFK